MGSEDSDIFSLLNSRSKGSICKQHRAAQETKPVLLDFPVTEDSLSNNDFDSFCIIKRQVEVYYRTFRQYRLQKKSKVPTQRESLLIPEVPGSILCPAAFIRASPQSHRTGPDWSKAVPFFQPGIG